MSYIDEYLDTLAGPERTELEHIRSLAHDVAPDAEEGQSYGMPALRYKKKPLIGFIAAKEHLSVFPFSPGVIDKLKDQLGDFKVSTGTIRFSIDNPIPDAILELLIKARMEEIDAK